MIYGHVMMIQSQESWDVGVNITLTSRTRYKLAALRPRAQAVGPRLAERRPLDMRGVGGRPSPEA